MGEAMPGMVLARSDGRRCMCVRAFVCVYVQNAYVDVFFFFLHMYAMNIL